MTLTNAVEPATAATETARRRARGDLLAALTFVLGLAVVIAIAFSGIPVLALLLSALLTCAWLLIRHLQS